MLRKSGGFQKILRAFEIYSENTQYSRNPLKQLLFTYYMFLLTMDGQYTFLYYMFLYYMFTITMNFILYVYYNYENYIIFLYIIWI